MYAYVKRMCNACPSCALSNTTRGKSSELVYGFPIEALFLVMHIDTYSAGKNSGLRDPRSTLLGVVVCVDLLAWNLLLTHPLLRLRLQS